MLLFLAFGSVVLPVKAIVMNVLSLSATFGVVVWIFQWGHLSGLLRFTPTGSIDPTMPILMAAIIFGLSMDYEVFLLSRIRERYDQTGDNTASVAAGLQRTGGLITSLALLLIIVVGAFSASGITFIKLMGVGMIVALLVDATVVACCWCRPPCGCSAGPTGGRRGRCAACTPGTGSRRKSQVPRRWPPARNSPLVPLCRPNGSGELNTARSEVRP